MLHDLIIHSPVLGARVPLAQPPHILLRLRLIDLETHDALPDPQLHRAHDLRAPRREVVMSLPARRFLGGWGGPAVLPFEVVGVGAGGGVGTVLAVGGIAKCDDELVVFFETLEQGA